MATHDVYVSDDRFGFGDRHFRATVSKSKFNGLMLVGLKENVDGGWVEVGDEDIQTANMVSALMGLRKVDKSENGSTNLVDDLQDSLYNPSQPRSIFLVRDSRYDDSLAPTEDLGSQEIIAASRLKEIQDFLKSFHFKDLLNINWNFIADQIFQRFYESGIKDIEEGIRIHDVSFENQESSDPTIVLHLRMGVTKGEYDRYKVKISRVGVSFLKEGESGGDSSEGFIRKTLTIFRGNNGKKSSEVEKRLKSSGLESRLIREFLQEGELSVEEARTLVDKYFSGNPEENTESAEINKKILIKRLDKDRYILSIPAGNQELVVNRSNEAISLIGDDGMEFANASITNISPLNFTLNINNKSIAVSLEEGEIRVKRLNTNSADNVYAIDNRVEIYSLLTQLSEVILSIHEILLEKGVDYDSLPKGVVPRLVANKENPELPIYPETVEFLKRSPSSTRLSLLRA